MIYTIARLNVLKMLPNFYRKDRAKPPARRGCNAYASESDTINLQSSIVNIQFRLGRVGFNLEPITLSINRLL